MKSYLLLGLFLFSGFALAAECDKIDYAEAKDWTPAQLEEQACLALKEMGNNTMLMAKASEGRGVLDPVAMMYSDQGTVCRKQYELYMRILKNVHHRDSPTPSCDKVPARK
jgi:hypothetical protein